MHPHPPPLVVRTSDLAASAHGGRELRRAAERGSVVRVVRGAYLDARLWDALGTRERYVSRVHATGTRLSGPVAVSHWSAAAVWGLPVPTTWPDRVQIVDSRRRTSTTRAGLSRRPGELHRDDVVMWEGVAVTTAERTAADICLISPFDEAVMVLDFGLHFGHFTKTEVARHLDRRPEARRLSTARAALEFATTDAEWPGESFSRVGMAMRGIATPTLQKPFFDAEGKIGHADFTWEATGNVGEFDGAWKYTDPRFMKGRTAAQVVRDEKRRHARFEAHPNVSRVTRWEYAVARNPDALASLLLSAGVKRS